MAGPGRAIGLMLFCLAMGTSASAGPIPQTERSELKREFILANTEFTVLHEIGHAVFQEFNVPLFSHEEESADTLATMLMILRYGMDADPRRMDRLLMVSAEWYDEWHLLDASDVAHSYWDDHPLSIQRFYNINCLVFGANQQMLGLLLNHPSELLPVERGWFCDREFARAKAATLWLYDQHKRPPARQGKGADFGPPMITVNYEEPETEEDRAALAVLKSDGLVEDMAGRLSGLLDWPHPIGINFVNCGGGTEAYFNERVSGIFICSGLITQFGRMADYQLDQGSDRVCRSPAIRRLMGDRLGCQPEAGSAGK
jgi:hypothetical protein